MERIVDDTDLLAPFTTDPTASGDLLLGVKLEYFPVHLSDLSLVPYDSASGLWGILCSLMSRYMWSPIYEDSNIVALVRGQELVTLGPGGAITYASSPVPTVWDIEKRLTQFLEEVQRVAKPMAVGLLPLGFHPFATPDAVSLTPQQRYHSMDAYMPLVGSMGRHMLKLTCASHVTIDFHSEADAMRKLQLAAKLTPFFVALSANSAVQEGRYSGKASTRVYAWMHTDRVRTGFPECVFHPQARFMDYVQWALDVPLYFLEREGENILVRHPTFREFLAQGIQLPNGRGRTYATLADWQLHLSTVFPWVRLGNYIALRAFDSNTPDIVLAMVALVKGLFYSPSSLNAVEALVGAYDRTMVEDLLHEAMLYGLDAEVDDVSFHDMLGLLIAIARNGLCDQGHHDYVFLKPFEPLALKRRTEECAILASVDLEQYIRSYLL